MISKLYIFFYFFIFSTTAATVVAANTRCWSRSFSPLCASASFFLWTAQKFNYNFSILFSCYSLFLSFSVSLRQTNTLFAQQSPTLHSALDIFYFIRSILNPLFIHPSKQFGVSNGRKIYKKCARLVCFTFEFLYFFWKCKQMFHFHPEGEHWNCVWILCTIRMVWRRQCEEGRGVGGTGWMGEKI